MPVPRSNWRQVLASTIHGPAKYHSDLSDNDVRALEMGYCRENFFTQTEFGGYFYVKYDRTIGAFAGKETNLIWIQHNACGAVHDYPISEDEFKKRWNTYREGEQCPQLT
jgi:hypothetical protein